MSLEIRLEIQRLHERHSLLETRLEAMLRPGTVADTDFSDPTKPRARIQHGTDENGAPVLGPWLPWMSHAGEKTEWKPVTLGQQMMQFAPDGVFENGMLVPYSFSQPVPSPETDKDTHVNEYGQHKETIKKDSHTRTIGGTTDHQDTSDKRINVPGKAEITAGDPSAAASSGAGGLGDLPHELNRQIQGIVARLGQHDHHIGALHQTMSVMNNLCIPKVPALAGLVYKLNGNAQGLLNAANDVVPELPDYVALALTQSVDKLANTFLGSVTELAQDNIAGLLGGLLGQAQSLVSGAGLTGGAAATASTILGQAQAAIPAAAAGGTFELGAQLAHLTNTLSGTPAAGALAGLVGQLQGVMGSTATLMGGLSGLLDGQVNASKGTIKSVLFGGY